MISRRKVYRNIVERYRSSVCRSGRLQQASALRIAGLLLSVVVLWLGLSVEAEADDGGLRFGRQTVPVAGLWLGGVEILADWDPPAISDQSETELVIYGRIAPHQHIYSIRPQGEFGPEPTGLFIEGRLLEPVSELMESDPISLYDGAFEVPLLVHQNDFEIRRRFRLGNRIQPGVYRVYGYLRFQICSDKLCSLPLEKPFTTDITVTLEP